MLPRNAIDFHGTKSARNRKRIARGSSTRVVRYYRVGFSFVPDLARDSRVGRIRQRANIRPRACDPRANVDLERNRGRKRNEERETERERERGREGGRKRDFLEFITTPFRPPAPPQLSHIRSRSRKQRRLSETSSDSETVIPFVFPTTRRRDETARISGIPRRSSPPLFLHSRVILSDGTTRQGGWSYERKAKSRRSFPARKKANTRKNNIKTRLWTRPS